jgi:bacillithiol biosynthesis cysteine-adding enzyme BshC
VLKVPKSISFARLPGGNLLFLDYIEHFDKLRNFFSLDYRQPPTHWLEHLSNAAGHAPDRTDLVEGLLEDAHRWNASRQTRKNIEALRDPATIAVLTGQQAGLFGGPLYTYYKAISTTLWARAIQKATGRYTVPIFWMETADHDFFEVNHVRLLDTEGEEILLSLTNPPQEKRRIVGTIVLNGEIERIIQRLWTLLPSSTYRSPFMELLSTCYHSGATLGGGFARFFGHLFAEDGLVLVDAENPRFKQTSAPLLDKILYSSAQLNNLLQRSTQAVHRAGYPPQIAPQEDRLQLFYRDGDVRVPISSSGTLLFDDKPPESPGIAELRRLAASRPELFLPKVSLRPILQDYLFPTLAFVAGPAEIAYMAQLKPLYEHLGVPMPVIVPRLSVTLIEPKIERVLEKYNFTPEQLRQGATALINQLLESDPANDLVSLFAEARQKWQEVKDSLTLGLMGVDPTLEHPVEKTLDHWRQGLEILEQKAQASLRRKNETLVSQINKALSNLTPGGQLQERRFCLPYYKARYGRTLSQRIRAQVQIDLFRHQLVYLGEGE